MCLYLSAVFASHEDSYFLIHDTVISVCRYVHFGRACCLYRLRGFLHGLPWIKRQQAAFERWYLHINRHDVIWTENRTFLFTSLMISYLCTLVFKALETWLCVSNLYIRCQSNIQPYRRFVWLTIHYWRENVDKFNSCWQSNNYKGTGPSEFLYRLFEGAAEIGFIAVPTLNFYVATFMYVSYRFLFHHRWGCANDSGS
jgi:hypothetical protein